MSPLFVAFVNTEGNEVGFNLTAVKSWEVKDGEVIIVVNGDKYRFNGPCGARLLELLHERAFMTRDFC